MNIEFKLTMISMPNFLTFEMPPGKKQDGLKFVKNTIPVENLSIEEIRTYAEEMRLAFIQHWQSKQKD